MDAALKAALAAGDSFAEAGRKVGVSRLAALGRASRKNFKSTHEPCFRPPHKGTIKVKPPKPPKAIRAPKAAVVLAPVPSPVGPVGTFPEDSASAPSTCRYIAGDPAQPDWRCCGAPTQTGLPYCSGHAVICYDGSVKPNATPFVTRGRHSGRAA